MASTPTSRATRRIDTASRPSASNTRSAASRMRSRDSRSRFAFWTFTVATGSVSSLDSLTVYAYLRTLKAYTVRRSRHGGVAHMKLNPESLARASSRHPWRVLIGWVVLVMACGAFVGAGFGDVLTTDIAFTNKPESIQAQDIIDQKFGGGQQENTEYVIVLSKTATVDDPAFQAYVTD